MKASLIHEKKFNKNVLATVCLVGLVRISVEIYRNISSWSHLDYLLAISYGIMFTTTLFVLWKGMSYETIRIVFYVPLIILLCLTLYERRGLASSIETNNYIALIIISLTMRSRDAIKFSVFLIIGTVISLTAVEIEHHLLADFTKYSTSHFNFIFMSIGSVVLTYYAKKVFEHRRRSLSKIKKELSENHKILKSSTEQLKTNTQELELLNQGLEEKVKERLILLGEKKRAIKEYLHLTSVELQTEYAGILELTVDSFKESEDPMSEMMIESSKKLEEEMKSLVRKLKEEK